MPDRGPLDEVKSAARGVYERLVGVEAEATDAGVASAEAGAEAVAWTEAAIARLSTAAGAGAAAGLGSTFPADGTDRAYRLSAPRAAGRIPSGSGRESLAAAVGAAAAGSRATAFLSGPDLIRSNDLLASAVSRRLPLVVHVADRAGGDVGGGHAALHAATAAGAVVLAAADVQEAVDFSVAGRRLAEEALVPVVVATEGAETAASIQDVQLPSEALLRAYLGSPADTVHPATRAQEMLFGRHRRRLPRWHDPSRPMTTGTLHGPESAPLVAAGRRAYLDAEVPGLLDAALAELGRRTGRALTPLGAHRLDGAKLVLVAVGAAIGTAEALADALKKEVRVGVVGIRALAPLIGERCVELLGGSQGIVVLERTDGGLVGSGAPLASRMRALLGGRDAGPWITSAFYGLGGAPLRAADLAALAREMDRNLGKRKGSTPRSPIYLGVSFEADVALPKREVLLDALRRSHPDAERLGLRGEETPDLRGDGTTVVALHRLAGRGAGALSATAGRLLVGIARRVTVRPGLTWDRWAAPLTDRLVFGEGSGPRDPGADAPVDVAVWLTPEAPPTAELVDRLVEGGAVVVPRWTTRAHGTGERDLVDWWSALAEPVREAVEAGGARLYVVEVDAEDPAAEGSELLLGALFGTLRAEGRIEFKDRRLLEARSELLADDPVEGRGSDAIVAGFQTGIERVRAMPTGALSVRRRPPDEPDPVPAAVRRLAGATASETVDSLPRFWDQVGVLYRRGEEARLTPDPYVAAGAVPALAGSLRQVERGRTVLPAFDPALCTGCGDCWSACPDGAIGPVAIGAAGLLDDAMGRARRAGRSVDALRMVASKIAAGVNRELAGYGDEAAGGDAAELFCAAFDKIVGKMPEGRREALREAFAAVREELVGLPVSRTEPFFEAAEAASRGSGELFLLAVDPDACKGCGVCIAECAPDALRAADDNPGRARLARNLWRRAEALPEPSSETVERARTHPEVGSLAGATLSKTSRATVAAADGADAGSGSSLAVRQSLAAAAFHLLPPYAERLAALDAVREELAGAIHDGLARALPDRDLDALAEGLGALQRPDADLSELTGRVERALDDERVDVTRLRRLVDVARGLADLRRRLGGGEEAGGVPAPLGLVLAGRAAAWGGGFPYTPFAVPVTVDSTGDAVGIARGVLEGSLAEAVELARVARRARIELGASTPSELARAAREVWALAELEWRDLDGDERALCPPVLVVASEDELVGNDLGGLADLLEGDLPVKVLLLSDAHLTGAGGVEEDRIPALDPAGRSGWRGVGASAWIGHRNALVVQSSVGAPDHLERGVAAVLAHRGPALVRVHAPEPVRHGFPAHAAVERARAAIDARVVPLFVSRPPERPDALPTVELGGNPEPESAWVHGADPARWALGEARFAGAFEEFDAASAGAGESVSVTDFVALEADDSGERSGEVPVVELPDGTALRVRPGLIRGVERCLGTWRLLQRWASADEAFAAAAAAADERDRAARRDEEHAREIEALRADYEQRLAEARATTQAEMARRVRGKLLALAARRAAASAGNGTDPTPADAADPPTEEPPSPRAERDERSEETP